MNNICLIGLGKPMPTASKVYSPIGKGTMPTASKVCSRRCHDVLCDPAGVVGGNHSFSTNLVSLRDMKIGKLPHMMPTASKVYSPIGKGMMPAASKVCSQMRDGVLCDPA